MKKGYIVDQTIYAAQSAIKVLQSGGILDINSVDKWTEGLLRYVLNINQGDWNPDPLERMQAQFIENIQFAIDDTTTPNKIGLLTELIAAIWEVSKTRPDLDQDIIWEPIFDRN